MSEFETWDRSNSGVYVTHLRGTFCTLRWDYQRSLELDGSGEIWREFGVVSLLCTEFSLKSLRWVDGDESAKSDCMPKHDDLNRQILSSIENCEAAHPNIFCLYVSRMVPETYERSRIVVVWSSVFVSDMGTTLEGDLFTLLILPSLNLTMQAHLSSLECLSVHQPCLRLAQFLWTTNYFLLKFESCSSSSSLWVCQVFCDNSILAPPQSRVRP